MQKGPNGPLSFMIPPDDEKVYDTNLSSAEAYGKGESP